MGATGLLSATPEPPSTPENPCYLELVALEDSLVAALTRRSLADPVATLASVHRRPPFGLDPFRIAPMPRSATGEMAWLVLLRGDDALAIVDDRFEIIDERTTPAEPTSWIFVNDQFVLVAGERQGSVALFALGPEFAEATRIELPAHSIRGLAFDPASRTAIALDPLGDRALAFTVETSIPRLLRRPQLDFELPAGPLQALFVDGTLLTCSLLDHTVQLRRLGRDAIGWSGPVAQFTHDGPIWSIDAFASGDTLWIVAGGVEDHPLDRTEGEFGYVDSFVFLYRTIRQKSGRFEGPIQVRRWNVSERGVVTPKCLRFDPSRRSLWVSGFGGERVLRLTLPSGGVPHDGPSHAGLETWAGHDAVLSCPPGISDFVFDGDFDRDRDLHRDSDPDSDRERDFDPGRDFHRDLDEVPEGTGDRVRNLRLVAANPLLDGIVSIALAGTSGFRIDPLRRTGGNEIPANSEVTAEDSERRLGELLVFTTLLTPENRSEGSLSRFTCEACHFEGGVDGRTHFTGRDQVYAATKPIRGLADNVPLFSRSSAATLAEMVPAEFRVANQARSDQHWIETKDHPWMATIAGDLPERVSPAQQRRAMLRFLLEFNPVPQSIRMNALTPLQRQGLAVFRDRCVTCHRPLRTTRSEDTAVPFTEWEDWLSRPAEDLVWGAPFLIKTGVTPYVSPAGARVPSLRRVLWKRPYFTNGSARTLEEVLDRFRFGAVMGWHSRDDTGRADGSGETLRALSAREQSALRALLERF